ncbi:serine/threonine-protein kinase TOUSLED-like isoform X20 [Xenia sp. Carnegie-2017]|uniref:serine/threonine-protein kinase TOUSLED-like isoform X19 n=1 Tax=Xenia sp. Carnegie-2017 TaxID=2897299 RepID=UPI001F03A950|nr:serine/threonine-protein kinase TOUSLED-like isoform X19 [Xenia sp. Carnegie-2017]XP_046843818.1 serine/threonine-protein kinase TOUSLED-like isoform X20 [Xenia sp. Carnegie-2017]
MDTKDSRISENGTEDSGILGIGTKDSEILEIGTKNLGISEIVTKDSGNLEIGTKDSEIWKEIRERQRLLCEALGYWEGVYGYAFLTSFYVVCLIALEYADRVYGYSFLSILLPLCCLGIGLVCLLYGVFIALWFADRVYGHSCLVYLLFGAYLIGVVYLLYGVFSALWFADRVYGYSCLVYLLFGAYLIGVVYLLYGVFSGLLYLLYVVSIGLLYLLYGVSIALGYADRVYGYSCSNNFQEPTLKESETDPSMKKDNKIKRLSEASYEKISLPFPMSDNDYDDIDKTPSTTVLDADDNLDLNTDSNDNDVEASKIREPSECQLNDNDSLEDSDAMPSSVCRAIEEVSHNDELKKVDQSSSSSTMKQHIKREGILPNITSLESDEKSKMRAFEDVNVAKSAVPSKSEAEKKERRRRKDSNDDDEASKITETSVVQLNDNHGFEDRDAMPSSVSKITETSVGQLKDNESFEDSDAMPLSVSHNDVLEKVDQSSSSSTMSKQHTKRGGGFPNITSLESDDESKMRAFEDVNVAKSAVPSESEADSNDDDEDDNNSEDMIGVSPSTSKHDEDDNLDEHFWMNTSFLEEEGKQRLEVQELLRQPWKCFDKSIIHQKKFKKMEKYGRKHPEKVTLLSELRVIFMKEFLLGKGSDGTRVYLALGNNGYGKAVKRIHKDSGKDYANREKEILIELNAKRSNHVVNFCHLEENLDEEYLYMILDLCEESLESYVKSSSLQDLQKVVPTILMQILKGLADLHSGERPILHRDLRPSNVLRDVDGNFLIADFGISHMLSNETSTHRSIQRGAKNWISPESYDASDASINKVRYKKESDIMNAGMVAYYFATKGKHPFGIERHRLDNILKGNPVGLDEIKDATFKDLLSWMLQLEPEDRPLANEALKHPYLQTDKENFAFLCDVGNEPEIKTSSPHSLPSNIREQLNLSIVWMDRIDPEFFNHFNKVSDSTWLGCLRFLRNVRQHWRDKPRPQLSSCVKDGNYQEYFLQLFEELPYLVHRAIRLSDWKARPDLEKHFPSKTQK